MGLDDAMRVGQVTLRSGDRILWVPGTWIHNDGSGDVRLSWNGRSLAVTVPVPPTPAPCPRPCCQLIAELEDTIESLRYDD